MQALYEAVDLLSYTVDGWRLAFTKVARLQAVSTDIQQAFLPIWIESKMLPLRVGNRRILANGLRLLLPGGYQGEPLTLYRGASWRERQRRLYGFSWTKGRSVALKFAERWQESSSTGGVVLRAVAPPGCVLLVRDERDYDEGEVVVDPFGLGRIDVAERLPPK